MSEVNKQNFNSVSLKKIVYKFVAKSYLTVIGTKIKNSIKVDLYSGFATKRGSETPRPVTQKLRIVVLLTLKNVLAKFKGSFN